MTPDEPPLHYIWMAEGENVPIVLIHGFGSSIAGWHPFMPVLPTGHAVLAIDLPGHGRSALGDNVSLEGFAASVATTIKHAGLLTFHLVGHSLGAAVAARVACNVSSAARSLTLISAAGLGSEINKEFLDGFTSARDEGTLEHWMQELVADPAWITPAFIRATLKPRREPTFNAGQALIVEKFFPGGMQKISIRRDLERIAIPTSMAFGSSDRIIPAKHLLDLPGSISLHVIDDVGHLPHIESQDRIAHLLLQAIGSSGTGCSSQ